jgi:hypothetical protein
VHAQISDPTQMPMRWTSVMSNSTQRSRIGTRLVALTVLVGAVLIAAPAVAEARGTLVLQQASKARELQHVRPAIRKALRSEGVTGLSVRVPWAALEPRKGRYNFRVLRLARRIAGTKQLQIRFMAGRYTPKFWRGNSMVYDGSATGGLGKGSIVPLPFGRDGGPNHRFERGWKRLVNHLVRWAKDHRVHLVHLSWPGLLWAELALTDQMEQQPGYSYRAARNTHFRLMNYALRKTTRHLSVEFAISGHAPTKLYSDITEHLLQRARRMRCVLGTTNLSDGASPMAAAGHRPPPRRGAQVSTQSNALDWAQVYDNARSIYAEYVEVYLPSFRGGTSGQLLKQAALFHGG